MPIDLYKLMGYDYRDKKRETQLSVDADVERARRIAADDFEAKKSQALELEGIAGKRFKENYAKTLSGEQYPEGLNEAAREQWARQDADTAWAKKVAGADLKDTLAFEQTAGALPGTQRLTKTVMEAGQEEAEAKAAKGKENKLRGLAVIKAIAGGGDVLGAIAESNLGAEAAGAKAGETEAKTKESVAAVLQPNAAQVALEQREAVGRQTQLGLAGAALANQARQNDVDMGRNELFEQPQRTALQRRIGEAQLGALEMQNEVNSVLGEDLRRAEIERLKAQADAARARGGGASLGLSGQALAPTRKGPLTADELDFGNSLR
jgi:hypothetical protein